MLSCSSLFLVLLQAWGEAGRGNQEDLGPLAGGPDVMLQS
jgi:hypothetical protein